MILIYKVDSGKYCAGCAISTLFDVIEVTPLPLATIDQQTELYMLTWACTLPKGKTSNIHNDSKYTSGVVYDFRIVHDF